MNRKHDSLAGSDMESQDERVKGVLLTMRRGNQDYDVILTDRRVIALYIGERLDPVSSMLPDITGSRGDPQAGSQWRAFYQGKSTDDMLMGHQWNLAVPNEEIKSVTVTRYPQGGGELLFDTAKAGWLHFVFAFIPELKKARMLIPQVFGERAVIRT
ncbi:MAG: hypothetical protein ACE5IJ_09560 [Thermoplasmata archaeon]